MMSVMLDDRDHDARQAEQQSERYDPRHEANKAAAGKYGLTSFHLQSSCLTDNTGGMA